MAKRGLRKALGAAGEEPKAFEVKAGEVLTLTAHVSEERDMPLGSECLKKCLEMP